MDILETSIKDLKIVVPKVHTDQRGFFLETFNNKRYKEMLNIDFDFVQDNLSQSNFGVLRGLHFQKKHPQGKLVRVSQGKIFDVAVDVRKESSSFGEWVGVELSGDNKKQFWIPPGFAHGFITLTETADLEYKCTDYYDPQDEGCLIWNDPTVNIDWLMKDPILSDKDILGVSLDQI